MQNKRLGVGFVGSGFIARFHMRSWSAVRDGDVLGVWSPNRKRAEATAAFGRSLDIGACKTYRSIAEMVADPAIDAIWLLGPNQARVENVEEIVDAIDRGKGHLAALACEKPLARNVAEATRVLELVRSVGLKHGYLENQCFAPQFVRGRELAWGHGAPRTGRPYLARAAEEHSGPHTPWFWRGRVQGGGVLNDMMCHSVLAVWHLLTEPGQALSTVKPAYVTGQIASLKWGQPRYARQLRTTMGTSVDYLAEPSEDYASVTIEFRTKDGQKLVGEATTSWGFVGAGLRLSAEVLGPEYSMRLNTLDSGLSVFLGRATEATGNRRGAREDLVEKQNAEIGQMPVVADEAAAYGYEAENRHFVRAFLGKEKPLLTLEEGLAVVKLLMTAYRSAEERKTLRFPPPGIERFVPKVAKGTYRA
jgi:predicted dehydrogenase